MRAAIFPGQGSQSIGMGKALAEASPIARAVFEEVDDALEQKLFALMCEGPAEKLQLTANAQPAIMANAIATLRVWEAHCGKALPELAAYVAGHSLGEYSALCAAGALDVRTTAKLLRIRGNAMQAAVPVGVGAMAALLGADLEKAQALCAAALAESEAVAVCTIANDNDPSQVVISGHTAAIEKAVALAKDFGMKRALLLPVSAPFHCPLMQPAAEAMAQALANTVIHTPSLPVIANVTAAPVSSPDEIRALLVAQVTGGVRWRESMAALPALGATHALEFGGKVLSPMVKRCAPDIVTLSLISFEDIAQAV